MDESVGLMWCPGTGGGAGNGGGRACPWLEYWELNGEIFGGGGGGILGIKGIEGTTLFTCDTGGDGCWDGGAKTGAGGRVGPEEEAGNGAGTAKAVRVGVNGGALG